MDFNIKKTKFGDIVLWDKSHKKFVVVRNYYKIPNLRKTNNFEICCIALGNGSFVSLFDMHENKSTWRKAMGQAKVYKGSAPIKSYLPNIDELICFYPFIEEFNRKINKLKSLGIECQTIKINWYWSSTEYSISGARSLGTGNGYVNYLNKDNRNYVRAFVAF